MADWETAPSDTSGWETAPSTAPQGAVSPSIANNPYAAILNKTAEDYGLDPARFTAQIHTESGFNPNAVNPTSGAQGLGQFLPSTAKDQGLDDPFDPNKSIDAAGNFKAQLKDQFGGDERKAEAAYNWGPGNLKKAIDKYGDAWEQHIPDETKNYLNQIDNKTGTGWETSAVAPQQDTGWEEAPSQTPLQASIAQLPTPSTPQQVEAWEARRQKQAIEDKMVYKPSDFAVTALDYVSMLPSMVYGVGKAAWDAVFNGKTKPSEVWQSMQQATHEATPSTFTGFEEQQQSPTYQVLMSPMAGFGATSQFFGDQVGKVATDNPDYQKEISALFQLSLNTAMTVEGVRGLKAVETPEGAKTIADHVMAPDPVARGLTENYKQAALFDPVDAREPSVDEIRQEQSNILTYQEQQIGPQPSPVQEMTDVFGYSRDDAIKALDNREFNNKMFPEVRRWMLDNYGTLDPEQIVRKFEEKNGMEPKSVYFYEFNDPEKFMRGGAGTVPAPHPEAGKPMVAINHAFFKTGEDYEMGYAYTRNQIYAGDDIETAKAITTMHELEHVTDKLNYNYVPPRGVEHGDLGHHFNYQTFNSEFSWDLNKVRTDTVRKMLGTDGAEQLSFFPADKELLTAKSIYDALKETDTGGSYAQFARSYYKQMQGNMGYDPKLLWNHFTQLDNPELNQRIVKYEQGKTALSSLEWDALKQAIPEIMTTPDIGKPGQIKPGDLSEGELLNPSAMAELNKNAIGHWVLEVKRAAEDKWKSWANEVWSGNAFRSGIGPTILRNYKRATLQDSVAGFFRGGVDETGKRFSAAPMSKQVEVVQFIIDQSGKKDWTPEELQAAGKDAEFIRGYKLTRDMLDNVLMEGNAARVANGLDPVPRDPGYAPSVWRRAGSAKGDFMVWGRDSDGKLVHVQSFSAKGQIGPGAQKFIEAMNKAKAEVPDTHPLKGITWSWSEIETALDRNPFNQDAGGLMTLVNSLPENHPLAKAASDLLTSVYNKSGSKFYAINKQHVRGFIGDEIGVSPEKNAKNFVRVLEDYTKGIGSQISHMELNRRSAAMFSDRALNTPNLKAYWKDYVDIATGAWKEQSNSSLVRLAQDGVQMLTNIVTLGQAGKGMPSALVGMANRMALTAWLPVRLSFLYTQVAQHLFSVPWMVHLQENGVDGNISRAMLFGNKNMFMPDKDFKAFMDWGAKNGVWDPHYTVEASLNKGFTLVSKAGSAVLDGVDKILRAPIAASEAYSRALTASYLFEFYKDAGYRDEALYQAVKKGVADTLFLYEKSERPFIYSKNGILGQAASPLATFKHGYWGQVAVMAKDVMDNPAKLSAYRPMAAFIAMQGIMAGLKGMIGIAVADQAVDLIRKVFNLQIKTPSEYILSTNFAKKFGKFTDALTYGVPSALTRLDLSRGMSAPQLDEGGLNLSMFAGLYWLTRLATQTSILVAHQIQGVDTTAEQQALAKSVVPSSFHGLIERYFQNPGNLTQNTTGQGTFVRPEWTMKNALQESQGLPMTARALGTRSLEERKQMDVFQALRGERETAQGKFQLNVEAAADRLAHSTPKGEMPDIQTEVDRYSKDLQAMNMSKIDFGKAVQDAYINKITTPQEREALKARGISGALLYNQYQRYNTPQQPLRQPQTEWETAP